MVALQGIAVIEGGISALGSLVSTANTISEMLSAQAGLLYNEHVFVIKLSDQGNQKQKKSHQELDPKSKLNYYAELPCLTIETPGTSSAEFSIKLLPSDNSNTVYAVVKLKKFTGFDTKFLDQASVNFSGVGLEGEYLLHVKGWVNPKGLGFLRFSASLLISDKYDSSNKSPLTVSVLDASNSTDYGDVLNADTQVKAYAKK